MKKQRDNFIANIIVIVIVLGLVVAWWTWWFNNCAFKTISEAPVICLARR